MRAVPGVRATGAKPDMPPSCRCGHRWASSLPGMPMPRIRVDTGLPAAAPRVLPLSRRSDAMPTHALATSRKTRSTARVPQRHAPHHGPCGPALPIATRGAPGAYAEGVIRHEPAIDSPLPPGEGLGVRVGKATKYQAAARWPDPHPALRGARRCLESKGKAHDASRMRLTGMRFTALPPHVRGAGATAPGRPACPHRRPASMRPDAVPASAPGRRSAVHSHPAGRGG